MLPLRLTQRGFNEYQGEGEGKAVDRQLLTQLCKQTTLNNFSGNLCVRSMTWQSCDDMDVSIAVIRRHTLVIETN